MLLLAVFDSWFYLVFYLSWVILVRLLMLWVYVLEGMRLRSLHIPLLLYNQWVGALIKIYSMFSLDLQTWDKVAGDGDGEEPSPEGQRIGGLKGLKDPCCGFLRNAMRALLLTLSFSLLVTVCGVISGVFVLPGLSEYSYYRTQWREGHLLSHPAPPMSGPSNLVRRIDVAPTVEAVNAAIASVREGERVRIVLPQAVVRVDEPILVDRDFVSVTGAGPGLTVLESDLTTPQEAVILVRGSKGPVVGHTIGTANRGDTVISVDDWPEDGRYIWLGAPNDDEFLDRIGDRHWRKETPWLRQFLTEVSGHGKGYVVLKQGLPALFPAGTEVRAARPVVGVSLSGFSIVQRAGDLTPEEAQGQYENLAPDHAVDGIRFDWAVDCSLQNATVRQAGRHPLVFENSANVRAAHLLIDGAWNKGKGGNGYVRFARCYNCELTDSEVRNVRHLAFQWSAANNRVLRSRIYTDVNFHGGYSRDNAVLDSEVRPPKATRGPQSPACPRAAPPGPPPTARTTWFKGRSSDGLK